MRINYYSFYSYTLYSWRKDVLYINVKYRLPPILLSEGEFYELILIDPEKNEKTEQILGAGGGGGGGRRGTHSGNG